MLPSGLGFIYDIIMSLGNNMKDKVFRKKRKKMKEIPWIHFCVKVIIFSVLFPWIISCAVNPVTGKTELMLLSEEAEIAMGRQTDPQIIRTYGIYNDRELQTYIEKIGNQMARISHRPQLNYEFKVMDSPVINAFAVPGGYVYLTRGILAYLNNEAELAGVMGHEIGHITARHSAQQYSKAQLAQLGLGLGAMVSESFSEFAGLAGQGISLLFLKFSRDAERQADSLGVEYSSKVGYDASKMANFFETLDKMHSGDTGNLPFFLTTHPNPENRVQAVKQSARKWQTTLGLTNPEVNRNRYLQMIDGIVFGDDPREGFVENNIFYHPEMQFMFPLPAGWEVNNFPSEVQVLSPDKGAAIILTLGTESTPKAEANKFVTNNNATVLSAKNTLINGFSTIVLVTNVSSQSGTLQSLSYFINMDRHLIVLHGFSGEQNFGTYQEIFKHSMNGFQKLRDRNKLGVQPDRIRLKKAGHRMSMRQALKQFGTAESDMKKLAILNGKDLTDIIPANTYLKIIEKGR